MSEQKVTPNYLTKITLVTTQSAPKKNQQTPAARDARAADIDVGAGPDATESSVDPSLMHAPGISTQRINASTGQAIMRLLHEDGGGKAETPPDFAQQLATLCDAGHALAHWAARYLAIKVCGRSTNTVAAKSRDLSTFIKWFVEEHGHGAIDRWVPRDTRRFMASLNAAGRQPTTINRALYTLKHFARWVHEQPGGVFQRFGLPVAEVEPYGIDEVDCKKLTIEQVAAVFAAARAAVEKYAARARPEKQGRGHRAHTPDEKRQEQGCEQIRLAATRTRPRRNLAVLGMLYYTGLRVSEVIALKRAQYDGACLHDIERKGGRRSRKLILHPECVGLVDDYLAYERCVDINIDASSDADAEPIAIDAVRPLFVTARSGRGLDRFGVRDMLAKLAQATGIMVMHKSTQVPMTLHPHQLRHTFGALYREASGSDTETAMALGHAGLQYVGRYVRKTDHERIGMLQSALSVPLNSEK